MLTKTNIAGINFDSYVMNASGINDSTLEELEVIASSSSSAIVMKSCTLEPRIGNPEPRYSRLEQGSIQCMGLPNLGYKKYLEFAEKLKAKYKKPIVASVAGTNLEEYRTLVKSFQSSAVDLIEVNLSCPNTDKTVIANNLREVKNILNGIDSLGEKPLGLKLELKRKI
jgi:dihydroorotate dehydrogenase (fumarate)